MDIIPSTRNRFSYYHLLCARTSPNSNIMSSLLEEGIMDCAYKTNVHQFVGQLKSLILPRAYRDIQCT